MRRRAGVFLVATGLTACAVRGETSRPPPTVRSAADGAAQASIEHALPPGHRAQHVYRGDLDGDGDDDALVVTGPSPGTGDSPRGLVALLHVDGGWRIDARNDRAVPCSACGGMTGDPLRGIDVAPGAFALHLEGGSRELWSATYRFRYCRADRRWMLDAVDRRVLDRATGAVRRVRAGRAEIGPLDFTGFDPADATLAAID